MAIARVTSQDVARLAGVHPSTVSRVLNRSFGKHTYDPGTVRRIENCARQLGYQPSHAARSLRMGKTMLVGVVVSDIANPFFGQMAAMIETFARHHGYRTLICNTQDDADLQAEHLADLAGRQVDGIILSPSGSAGCERLVAAKLPLVVIDRPLPIENVPYVGLDNAKAGRILGEHLRSQGMSRVGVVMPDIPHDPTLVERFQGLLKGMGDTSSIAWTESGSYDRLAVEGRRRVSERLAGANGEPMAVVGLTNHCTLTAVHAVADADLELGRQIGVAGIDDFSAATVVRPGITVIAQPISQIAKQSIEMLVDLMAGRSPDDDSVRLEPTLLPRGSLGEKLRA